MLVATPGQTTSYQLHSSGSTQTKLCHSTNSSVKQKSLNSSGNSSTANNCTSSSSLSVVARPAVSRLAASSTALIKTLSVQLNRGTEFLKETMQKTLINNITGNSDKTTTTGNAANSSFKSNLPNRTTNTTAATKHNSTSAGWNCTPKASAAIIIPGKTATKAQTSSACITLYTVPPTAIHRYTEERQLNSSTDSLHKEMCHFKPIRAAPTTPWKSYSKSRGGAVLKTPKARLATKKNYNCDDPTPPTRYDKCSKTTTGYAFDDIESRAHQIYKPKPSSALLTTIISAPSHQSAFVRLGAEISKPRSSRGRTKTITLPPQNRQKSPTIVPLSRGQKQQKANVPTELKTKKCARGKQTKGVSKKISAVTATNSKAKSKMVDISAFGEEHDAHSSKSRSSKLNRQTDSAESTHIYRKQRKRKYSAVPTENEVESDTSSNSCVNSSSESSLAPTRKRGRRTKGYCKEFSQIKSAKKITPMKAMARGATKRSIPSFSPPLTRLRLKILRENSVMSKDD